MFEEIISFIKGLYPSENPVPLHAPRFIGNEKKYLNECIDSTYVSYVGSFVNRFESMIQEYTGVKHAIATANGTLALHVALIAAGVKTGDEVITQGLTFVATANAIAYCCAKPIFIDSDSLTLGMSPEKLNDFLAKNTEIKNDGFCYNKKSGKRIAACVPMHVFGHPIEIDKIKTICDQYHLVLIEDSAESLGSFYQGLHTGNTGKMAILSFNGNKIVTTGGGGMVLTNDETLAKRLKHITTTAKIPHRWEFNHDEIGYNYRMPNVNAAIGCAQMEHLPDFRQKKRELAEIYRQYFSKAGIEFAAEPENSSSNYWLNTILLKNRAERDSFLEYANSHGVMSRPAWTLMSKLPMFNDCLTDGLETARTLEDRIVNIPSSVRI